MHAYTGPAGNCMAVKGQGTEASLRHLAEIGLNAQEIEFVHQVFMKREDAEKTGAVAADLGIRLSIHAPYYINLCSAEKQKVAASKKRVADSLDRAEAMGATGAVAVHSGFLQGRKSEECAGLVVDACKELAGQYPRAVLGLETTGKHSAFGSLDEVLEVCKRVGKKNCVPVVDFAHLYARNAGKIEYGPVLDKLLSYGHARLNAHFSGIAFTNAGESHHLPLSSKSPDFAVLAHEFAKRKDKFEDVCIICESPLMEDDALVMKDILVKQGLWK